MKGNLSQTPDAVDTSGALSADDQRRLDRLYRRLQEESNSYVGYPCSANFDFSPLFRFLKFPLNNIGDPYKSGSFRVETREIERDVVDWVAKLTHFPEDEYWGYVTNGGTEGNIYGLFLARELMPDGIVYYSEDAHYSVPKNLRVLNMKHIMIKSRSNGEMDCEDLRETIRIHRDVPPIIFANIGTTMTEAVDDVQHIRTILRDLAIPRSYIHCDAALSGMTLPFMPPQEQAAPVYDFRAGIDSIAISGHKYIGAPIPCGIVVARRRHVDRIARSIEYVGSLDTTISGSRNGFTPLMLWYMIRTIGLEGLRQEVAGSVERAEYAIGKLKDLGIEAWRNPFAITVVFPKPAKWVLKKWQIAAQGDRAHMVVTRSTSRELIDRMVADLVAARQEVESK